MLEQYDTTTKGLFTMGIAGGTFLLSALGIWGVGGFLICLFILSIISMIGGFIYAVHDK